MLKLRLFEASPAWSLEEATLVGFDLSFTQGIRLTGIDTTCDTSQALEDISRALHDTLCSVPENAFVRFHSLELAGYDELLEQYRAQFPDDALGAYVAKKKVEQCDHQVNARRRELYCFVSTPPELPFAPYNPNLLGRRAGRMLARARELHEGRVQEVTRITKTVARGLEKAGAQVELLGGQELFAVLWRMANPLNAMSPPAYRTDFVLRDQLFASGVQNHLDWFEREAHFNRVVTLKLPPRHVAATQAMELQGLSFPHHVVVTLRRVGDADALRRVETNRRQGHEVNRVFAKLRGADRHSEMPDHALIQQQTDVNDVLARLNRGERLFDLVVQVWFAAKDPDELHRRTEAVFSRFRSCGQADGAAEELRSRFAFLSMLPGHHALIGERYHPFLASRAADLIPIYASWAGAPRPTALLLNCDGGLLGFHPFMSQLPAWNATIAGGTGTGKSFTTRTLLTGWLASGGRVIVATRGPDYHRYAEIFGGQTTDISVEDNELAMGPFPIGPSGGLGPEALEHLAAIIGVMVTDEGGSLNRLQRRLVYKATETLYQNRATNLPAPTFDDWITTLEAIVAQEPDSAPLARELVKQLRYWLDGPYGRALRRNRTGDDARLSVWNLEHIRDAETLGVVLSVLSGLIAQSIKAGPTVVVLDEVWALLKSEAGAQLVETLYRTVRKQGSAIWTISQSMNDYAALAPGCRSAILNNSPIKLFLAHDSSDLELVAGTFQLNPRESELLRDLKAVPGRYSDILAFFGTRRQVLRLVPTGIEYWIATSHRKDCNWESVARAARPELERAELLKRLARKYPHGAIELHVA